MWRRWTLVVALAATLIVAGGCEMAVDVGLDVEPDGSGEVTVAVELDADAVERVPDLAAQLRLDDLVEAGWEIDGPTPAEAGARRVVATRVFAGPQEATTVLAEVGGEQGPFQRWGLARRSGLLTTDFTFTGAVDLRDGIDAFADDELRASLAGSGFSLATDDLEGVVGAPIDEVLRFTLRADLPGRMAVTETGSLEDGAVVWRVPVGERVALAATSELLHGQRLAWLALSALAAIATVVAVVLGRRRRRHELR